MTNFLLPPDDHYKYITTKENDEELSRELRVHLVKDATISSSKSPKVHAKLATHMHYENGFEIIIAIIFRISPQLGGIGPKYQDLVIPFCLSEGEFLTAFHILYLKIKSELISIKYKTCKINNLTRKYNMELSKLKHIQRYMTSFDID